MAGVKRSGEDFDPNAKRARTAEPSKVLHVRGLPPFTSESELVSLVAPYGQVVKCLLLQDKHQAFLQMETIEAAQEALAVLEFNPPVIRGRNVYFQFSSRQQVETKSGPVGVPVDGVSSGEVSSQASSILLITVLNVTVPVTLENIVQICKPYGEVLKIITFQKGTEFQALVQMCTVDAAINAKLFLEGKDMFQGCCHLRVGFSKRTNLTVKQNNHKSRDFTQPLSASGTGVLPSQGLRQGGIISAAPPAFGGGIPAMSPGGSVAPVVLVNKLVEGKITPDILFTLFGVYGDVLRVKILFNKRDTALLQFATSQQAAFAVQHLNGCPLHGQNLVVSHSKHVDVKLPREEGGQLEGKDLTKDYTGSPAHRFKNKSFMNPKNVNAPSQVLHVANLHDNATEQELRELFGAQQPQSGNVVVEFFKNSRKMAYVATGSVEEAVHALLALHNFKLGGYPLRVSFSHKEATSLVNSDLQQSFSSSSSSSSSSSLPPGTI